RRVRGRPAARWPRRPACPGGRAAVVRRWIRHHAADRRRRCRSRCRGGRLHPAPLPCHRRRRHRTVRSRRSQRQRRRSCHHLKTRERTVHRIDSATRSGPQDRTGAPGPDGRPAGEREVAMARPSKLRVAVSDPAQWLSERERAQMLAPKLRALADETRLTLILLIAQRPRTVKELQEATGLSQTLVSHHLAPLREQNLVEAIPKGRSNQYVMCCQTLAEPLRMFASLAAMDPETVAACLQTEADQPPAAQGA